MKKEGLKKPVLIGNEIWSLALIARSELYKDMQRVTFMKYFDPEYYESEFPKVRGDFIVISNFGRYRDELKWSEIKCYWMDLRNIISKYMDTTTSEKFAAIDKKCGYIFCRMPEIQYAQRPTKPLPKGWRDNNPEWEDCLNYIIRHRWFDQPSEFVRHEDVTIGLSKVKKQRSCSANLASIHSVDWEKPRGAPKSDNKIQNSNLRP